MGCIAWHQRTLSHQGCGREQPIEHRQQPSLLLSPAAESPPADRDFVVDEQHPTQKAVWEFLVKPLLELLALPAGRKLTNTFLNLPQRINSGEPNRAAPQPQRAAAPPPRAE